MVWGRYCACEILIANPIDWLFAACLEYFIFFSIDSSEARKQYDEYCLSIMQTITYAQGRMVVEFTTTCASVAYHHLSCEFEPNSWRGVLDKTLSDKVCQ